MKIKDAINIMGRSPHAGIFIKCLEHKDGLTYKELYEEYCKRCKYEGVRPIVYSSIYAIIRLEVAKGFMMKKRSDVTGKRDALRVWLVK